MQKVFQRQFHQTRFLKQNYSNSFTSKAKFWSKVSFSILAVSGLAFYASDSRAAIHKYLILPIMRELLDPEESHNYSLFLLKNNIAPVDRLKDDPVLRTKFANMTLSNPVGLAAGYDKNAEAIPGLFKLGFGLVEVGSVTPISQPGNPKPRMFRLFEDEAVINRYGFNSDGFEKVVERLRQFRMSNPPPMKALGINLGKNKRSPHDDQQDYFLGIQTMAPFADYLVVNISSPNTPGLRDLQSEQVFDTLLEQLVHERNSVDPKLPLLIKIAPDLKLEELESIAKSSLKHKIDGVIISNTTIQRPETLISQQLKNEKGGLSGKPLKPLSLKMVSDFYKLTNGKVPIVGCGGISSGKDALDYILAGASVVQLYTSMAYEGPGIVRDIKDYLAEECHKRGVTNLSQLVGTGNK